MGTKVKTKRNRQQNWGQLEKERLRQLIGQHLQIVEDKGNDMSTIKKKKAAWEAIRNGMIAAGYIRSAVKIRQQWTRMKVFAKKAKTPTNQVIKEEDPILIDCNSMDQSTTFSGVDYKPFENPVTPISIPMLNSSVENAASPTGSNETDFIDSVMASVAQSTNAAADLTNSSLPSVNNMFKTISQLPKKLRTSCHILSALKVQILEATSQAAELHLLHMRHAEEILLKAKEDNARAREIHSLDILQRKELHKMRLKALECKQQSSCTCNKDSS